MIVASCKDFYIINDEDQEALSYKTLTHTNTVASHRVYKFWVFPLFFLSQFGCWEIHYTSSQRIVNTPLAFALPSIGFSRSKSPSLELHF